MSLPQLCLIVGVKFSCWQSPGIALGTENPMVSNPIFALEELTSWWQKQVCEWIVTEWCDKCRSGKMIGAVKRVTDPQPLPHKGKRLHKEESIRWRGAGRGTCQVEERHKGKEHKLIHPCNKYLLSERTVCQAQRQSVGDGMGEGHGAGRTGNSNEAEMVDGIHQTSVWTPSSEA